MHFTEENTLKDFYNLVKTLFYIQTELANYFKFDITDNEKCKNYMIKYLRIMMEVSSIMLIISKDKELLEKKEELWQYVKDKDIKLYKKLRYSVLGWTVNLPGRLGRQISSTGYRVMNKIIGFN